MAITNFTDTLSRTGITAPDVDGSKLSVFTITPTTKLGTVLDIPPSVVRLGAVSDTPKSTLTASVLFLDKAENLVGVQQVTFTASSSPDWGTSCVGIPDGDPWWPFGGATYVVVKIDAVKGGTWTINGTTG